MSNIMIGAVKSGKIRFDGKRLYYEEPSGTKAAEIVAYISSYEEITTIPGNKEEVSKKINAWAKRKGYKVIEG